MTIFRSFKCGLIQINCMKCDPIVCSIEHLSLSSHLAHKQTSDTACATKNDTRIMLTEMGFELGPERSVVGRNGHRASDLRRATLIYRITCRNVFGVVGLELYSKYRIYRQIKNARLILFTRSRGVTHGLLNTHTHIHRIIHIHSTIHIHIYYPVSVYMCIMLIVSLQYHITMK